MIQLVPSKQVDRKKWDALVDTSPFAAVYAKSWFLDAVCSDWCLLVNPEYSMGLPLVNGSKFGQLYAYQPLFAQRFNLFHSLNNVSSQISELLNAIPATYRLVDLQLGFINTQLPPGFKLQQKNNQVLQLDKPYELITKNYHKGLRYAIRRANKNGLIVTHSLELHDFDQFVRNSCLYKKLPVYLRSHQLLMRLIESGIKKSGGKLWGVYHPYGELIATAFTIEDASRLYYLFQCSNQVGRKYCASHLLTDTIIQDAIGHINTLDFVGSEISSIAFFNRQFGCDSETYYHISAGSKSIFQCLYKSIKCFGF